MWLISKLKNSKHVFTTYDICHTAYSWYCLPKFCRVARVISSIHVLNNLIKEYYIDGPSTGKISFFLSLPLGERNMA